MADKLDELIEWLVDEVVYSGNDGISVSQLLARVSTFYSDAEKPTRTTNGTNGRAHENLDQSKPVINHAFKEELWKRLKDHQDILVGESGSGNGLTLGELQAFHRDTPTPQALSATDELPPSSHEGGASLQGYDNDPSSPSAQLLEQIQSQSIHKSATGEDLRSLALAKSTRKDSNVIDVNSLNSLIDRDEVDQGAFQESHTRESISPCDDGPDVEKAISPHLDAVKLQPRICTSMTRKWMTIVGRKPDFRRISKSKWQCLYTIGQARDKGISQQQLLHATSRDEESLSPQLNQLVQKGYVVRKQIAPQGGLGSTLFILKRFSDRMTTPIPEPTIHEDMTKRNTSQSLLEEDRIAVRAIPAADGIGKNDSPKAQTPHYKGQLLGADESLSSPPPRKENRGRPRIFWATHTTYDECQIADGVPGVYRNISQFNEVKASGAGRPKRKLRLLFKSKKLKGLPWFHKQLEENSSAEPDTQETAPVESTDPHTGPNEEDGGKNLSTKRSFVVDTDDSDIGRPLKRAIIDTFRDFGRRAVPSYQTLTQPTPPSLRMTPNLALISPESLSVLRGAAVPVISAPSNQYVSPYASSAPPGIPNDRLAAQTGAVDSSVAVTTPNTLRTNSEAAAKKPQVSTVAKCSYTVQTRASARALAGLNSFGKEQPQAQIAEQVLANDDATLQDEQPGAALRPTGENEPRYFSRLSTNKDGITGNLCLSVDRQSLTFLADRGQPDSPKTNIRISEIKGPPENVAIDPNTMELRIVTIDEAETEILHSFPYLSTDAENGNVIRANIVTAIAVLNFENDEESPAEVEKPFKCDQCGGSWMNQEGIKYHQTRSKTACNPQFSKRRKKATSSTKRRARRVAAEASENDIVADGNLVEKSTPALEKLSTQSPVVNGHLGVLSTLPAEYSTNVSEDAIAKTVAKPAQVDPKICANVTKIMKLESPHQRSKDIIMALLDAHGEVFPGDCSLWRAYEATWIQTDPESSLPDRNYWDATLKFLIDSGYVRSMQFSFKDESGLMRMRTIVTKNGVDPASTEISELKELMKAIFPEHYHPPLTALPKVVQSVLKTREDRYITKTPQKPRQTRSGRIIKEVQKLSTFEDELLLLRTVAGQGESQTPSMNEALDGGVGIEERSDRSTSFIHTPADETDSDFVQPRKRRKIQHPPASTVARAQPWQPAVDFLQNERGAWSNLAEPQRAIPFQVERGPARAKRRPYRARAQLPEPITYMQTFDSSAWAFRPYGHGVRPIHARPSLRVSKNVAYLEKIEQGFRPIIMPTSYRSRPIPLSRTSKSLEIGAGPTPSVEGTRHKRMRSSSTIAENRNDTSAPPAKRRGRPPRRSTPVQPFPTPLPAPTTLAPPPTHIPLPATSALRLTHIPPDFDPRSPTRNDFVRNSVPFVTLDQPVRRLPPTLKAKSSLPAYQILPPNLLLGDGPEILDPTFSRFTETPTMHTGVGDYAGHSLVSKRVGWWDENSLTLGRLPYGELRSNEDNNMANDPARTRAKERPKWAAARKTLKTRRLTALPGDLGVMMASVATYPDLAVEVASEHHQNNPRRRNKGITLSREMENRLKVAVVAIRTLTGGLDKQIDWVLVSRLFPQLSLNSLRNTIWPPIAAQHKLAIERLGREFEAFFIKAYEGGQVPPINYDHLVDYDWERLVELVSERVVFEVDETAPRLPASRSELEQSYEVKLENQRPWRDDFFTYQIPVYKRVEKSSLEQITLPLESKSQPQQPVDDLTIARSWARANTLTPQNSFDPDFAQSKLSNLPNGLLKIATNELIARKVLTHRNRGRPVPGRGFELSDTFDTTFRKHLNERHLSDAYAFKASLDRAFLFGEKVMVQWAANDGDILAMTNLQAYGRINLIPGDNVPMERFGLTGVGNYQTKKMEKSKLRFDIEIRPTSSYLYTLQLPILSKSPTCLSHPNPIEAVRPPQGINGAIPLWYDIGGNLIKDWWKKVLCTVMGTAAMRPGIGTKELARLFAPSLEEWEIRLVMEWGCIVGALIDVREEGEGIEWRDGGGEGEDRERDMKGKGKEKERESDADEKRRKLQGIEGWSTGEWWWVIGGRDW